MLVSRIVSRGLRHYPDGSWFSRWAYQSLGPDDWRERIEWRAAKALDELDRLYEQARKECGVDRIWIQDDGTIIKTTSFPYVEIDGNPFAQEDQTP